MGSQRVLAATLVKIICSERLTLSGRGKTLANERKHDDDDDDDDDEEEEDEDELSERPVMLILEAYPDPKRRAEALAQVNVRRHEADRKRVMHSPDNHYDRASARLLLDRGCDHLRHVIKGARDVA